MESLQPWNEGFLGSGLGRGGAVWKASRERLVNWNGVRWKCGSGGGGGGAGKGRGCGVGGWESVGTGREVKCRAGLGREAGSVGVKVFRWRVGLG